MEAIKTQTALQLKSLSERNVALLRQINNRISEEQGAQLCLSHRTNVTLNYLVLRNL